MHVFSIIHRFSSYHSAIHLLPLSMDTIFFFIRLANTGFNVKFIKILYNISLFRSDGWQVFLVSDLTFSKCLMHFLLKFWLECIFITSWIIRSCRRVWILTFFCQTDGGERDRTERREWIINDLPKHKHPNQIKKSSSVFASALDILFTSICCSCTEILICDVDFPSAYILCYCLDTLIKKETFLLFHSNLKMPTFHTKAKLFHFVSFLLFRLDTTLHHTSKQTRV